MSAVDATQSRPVSAPEQAPNDPISHVLIYSGGITVPQTNVLRNQLAFLNQPPSPQQGITHVPARRVLIVLSSWGGNTFEARGLYGLIRSMPYAVEVHATGVIKSAALPVMLACDSRTADPSTTFLFHPWTWGTDPHPGHTSEQLQQFPLQLEDDTEWGKRVLGQRTTLSHAQIDDLFVRARIEDATFALNHGIVHNVGERKIPHGVMTWNIA